MERLPTWLIWLGLGLGVLVVGLALYLFQPFPEGPSEALRREIGKTIQEDVKDSLGEPEAAQNLTIAKATHLADRSLEEAAEAVVEEGLLLAGIDDVRDAVDDVVKDAISADPQVEEISVSSLEESITDNIAERLSNLPGVIVGELSTDLELAVEQELVSDTLTGSFLALADENVSLDEDSGSQITALVEEVATAQVEALEIPPTDPEVLATDLTNEVAGAIVSLDGDVSEDVTDDITQGEVTAREAEDVAAAVADDATEDVDEILKEIVDSEVDPSDSQAGQIVGARVDDSIVGQDAADQAREVVIEAVAENEQLIQEILGLGGGLANPLKGLLVTGEVSPVGGGLWGLWLLLRRRIWRDKISIGGILLPGTNKIMHRGRNASGVAFKLAYAGNERITIGAIELTPVGPGASPAPVNWVQLIDVERLNAATAELPLEGLALPMGLEPGAQVIMIAKVGTDANACTANGNCTCPEVASVVLRVEGYPMPSRHQVEAWEDHIK